MKYEMMLIGNPADRVDGPIVCERCGSDKCVNAWCSEEGPEAGIHLLCMKCEKDVREK